MREDRADHVSSLNTCCRVYRHINYAMLSVKTIVLDFHLTCYRRINGSCQHDKTVQRKSNKV